ncbi:6,7-dimethyl-8-ribityllumazine synthase [Oscillibacter sp.]|uniref:6,7-dimethyl-8-ribityllumazine synthase n=1 Tax=Oscillibacter sp. TaxID=1945593 RepID=UPI0028AA4F5F|nr:6,7-dimethyl-8-ribityllumazine synthase [Oscillibacter sp.]
MKTFEGNLVSNGLRVGIVTARFNEFIVSKLLSGCENTLVRHGVKEEDISLMWVPGAFEIPLAASKRAGSKAGNKGSECAESAIEMANPLCTLRSSEA